MSVFIYLFGWCNRYEVFENTLWKYKSILLIKFLHFILKHILSTSLLFGKNKAFGIKTVHCIISPPCEILKTGSQSNFWSQEVVVTEMIYDLKIMQIVIKWLKILMILLTDTSPINTVSLNSELEMKHSRIEIGIFMPSSFKKSFLETEILFTNEDFCLLVQSKSTTIHNPFRAIFYFLSFIFWGDRICIPANDVFSFFAWWMIISCLWFWCCLRYNIWNIVPSSTFGLFSSFFRF